MSGQTQKSSQWFAQGSDKAGIPLILSESINIPSLILSDLNIYFTAGQQNGSLSLKVLCCLEANSCNRWIVSLWQSRCSVLEVNHLCMEIKQSHQESRTSAKSALSNRKISRTFQYSPDANHPGILTFFQHEGKKVLTFLFHQSTKECTALVCY